MDGVVIKAVDLRRMIDAMVANDLVHAAPALHHERSTHFQQMAPHKGFGRSVMWIDYHFDLFTRGQFACLQDLVTDKQEDFNHHGWVECQIEPHVCKGNLGILDIMGVSKKAGGFKETSSYNWQ